MVSEWHKVYSAAGLSLLTLKLPSLSFIKITYGDVKVKLLNDLLTYYKAL